MREVGRAAPREWLPAAALGFAAMAAIQTGSTYIAGNDGYYHVKMALLIPDHGILESFPWLRWTILNERFVSHHYGFHVLLVPFVWLADKWAENPAWGGKFAAAFAMGATFASCNLVMRQREVPHRLLWLLLLTLLPGHFWLRMSYVRAPMAALPLMLLAVWLILSGRVLFLGLLAFVFTHIYGGAVLFPLLPLAFVGASLFTGQDRVRALSQMASVVVGVGLGAVLSPYFPENLSFYFTQLFQTGLGAAKDVGGEWKPYDTWAFMAQAAPISAIWLICLIFRLQTGSAARSSELGILLLNFGFLVLMLKSRRFVEYWPVFALLNAADFAAVASRYGGANSLGRLGRPPFPAIAMFVAGALGIANLRVVRSEQRPSHDVAAIREAMAFLQENSQAGSMVFTDDWDIFPVCFYFNHHNTYAVGLDPEFTRTRFPALWERYRCITRAQIPARLPENLARQEGEDPAIRYEDIRDVFGAAYVLIAEDHPALFRAMRARPETFPLVYPGRVDPQPAIAIFATSALEADPAGSGAEQHPGSGR